MIILTSNGISNDLVKKELHTYIHKNSVALVVTADDIYKENNYHVPRHKEDLLSLGLDVEVFDFDNRKPEEINKFDVVFLICGNPYYFLDSIIKNNFKDVLNDFALNKIIIGCSAGSIVLTPSLKLIDIYSPDMNIVGLNDLSALNFTSIQILPHYSKFISKYDNFEDNCRKYEIENKCEVNRLNDGEALFIHNNEI